jgi:hypothetical protein
MRSVISRLLRFAAMLLAAWAVAANTIAAAGQKVVLKDGRLTLAGYLYKPEGNGQFPALIWNYGSEKHPLRGVRRSRTRVHLLKH